MEGCVRTCTPHRLRRRCPEGQAGAGVAWETCGWQDWPLDVLSGLRGSHLCRARTARPGQTEKGGGHGGHNGLRDIHAQLGTPDYWRLRLGIGHPGVKHEVANYVLRKPPQAEREAIFKCIAQGLDATDAMLAGDMSKAVALVHAQPPRPKPPRKEQAPTTPDADATNKDKQNPD